MELPDGRGRLGYCLNVHPTQTLAEVVAALTGPARAVKAGLSPDQPFGVGLRLSAEAAATPGATETLAAVLAGEGMTAFTMNGFPYGVFHGATVKQAVYSPDWTTPERGIYTRQLAAIMAALTPDGGFASISTVPGGFAPTVAGREADIAEGLLQAVADLIRLHHQTGRVMALALEPEPWCLLETVADAVQFFTRWLFSSTAVQRLAALAGIGLAAAAEALPRHLGVCVDVCHLAVGFEDPAAAFAALAAAGIPIHKLQLSSALRLAAADQQARAGLAAYVDPVYLHQVVARHHDGRIRRFLDLPDALASDSEEAAEWRVHFHVPLFADPAPPLAATGDVLETVLALHRAAPLTRHLEVETYTWGVLPPDVWGDGGHRDILTAVIERELRWVLQRLA